MQEMQINDLFFFLQQNPRFGKVPPLKNLAQERQLQIFERTYTNLEGSYSIPELMWKCF